VSPSKRCDEILRILDDALSDLSDLPARGFENRLPGEAAPQLRAIGSRYRWGQSTQTGSSGANEALLG